MASLVQILNKWEIQMLVLLSFMLQAFLFFGGGLRRHTKNGFLRILVWTAYLGADLVAAYALGLISRQDDAIPAGRDMDGSMGTHQLAVIWAPFLLIHLGGQDTITGFSLEDNNLWQRHLLNLVVQVALVLYIFWKLANGHNEKFIIVPGILLFVTGIIKYGERTWALRSGVLRSLSDFGLPPYATQLRETIMASRLFGGEDYNQLLEQIGRDDSSSGATTVLSIALCSIDSALSFLWHDDTCNPVLHIWVNERGDLLPKVLEILEIELGLVDDYIYTKAVVFQTKGGIILRCISQASFLASFLVFLLSNKQRYNSIDTAVTYALFVGGFGLEVCGVCTTVSSPWSWAWLETRHCGFLASVIMRWQRKRVLWSNSMGQYNLHNYLGQYDHHESSSWKQGMLMSVTRNVVDAVCGAEQKFWISKQLDTKFVKVDKEIIWCIFQKVIEYKTSLPQQWPNLGAFLQKLLRTRDGSLNWITIAVLHTYTQAQLRVYSESRGNVGDFSNIIFVRKLSWYMVYLLVTQPEMLPLSKDVNSRVLGTARYFAKARAKIGNNTDRDNPFLREIMAKLGVPFPNCCTTDELLEIKEAWVRLLIYIAGRSRPEMHATQLARGGELLTFVWLFMAFKFLGDSAYTRIDIYEDDHVEDPTRRHKALFRLPPVQPQQADGNSSSVPYDARTPLMEFLMDES